MTKPIVKKLQNQNESRNYFSPIMYLLKEEKKDNNIDLITREVQKQISTSINKHDMDMKLGTKVLKKSLERQILRNFPILKEISRLSLMRLEIVPVNVENEFLLAITIAFPPHVEKMKTPESHIIATFIQGWVLEKNIKTICPIVIINDESHFISN